MSSERWRSTKELFARAVELPDNERQRFLEVECEGDRELFADVVGLLTASHVDDFLETPRFGGDELVPRPHATIGDFELLEVLGRGGMGVVYRAREKTLDREVALKVLPRPAAMEQRRVDRFTREAHAAARLEHPAIVPIHSVGEDDGLHYFAMQYVRGRSLHGELDLLRARRGGSRAGSAGEEPILPDFDSQDYVATVVELACRVAEALHYAHQNGVVHSDVKPQNLLLDLDGSVYVADFGLVKPEELGSSQRGEIASTPFYSSPEQVRASRIRVDHRTDVFSLGVVLYEMLTLCRPFSGSSSREVFFAISFNEPRAIRKIQPRAPRDLETICVKALSKRPDARYASAGELADDLKRFLGHEAIHARRPSPLSRLASRVSLRRNW